MNPLLGVFGAVGTWPDWQRHFRRGQAGMLGSFAALLLCVPALWFVWGTLEARRAQVQNTVEIQTDFVFFAAMVILWAAAFAVTAAIIALLMRRTEGLTLWIGARNWAVVFLSLALAAVFALVRYTPLPFSVAEGALFAAYLGLLPIDIRLAQRAGGFPLMSAILVGCVVVSTSLLVLLSGLQFAINS